MVVNKDGSLELYHMHDTPRQTAWSSRGGFALSAGVGLKFIEGYHSDHDSPTESRHPSTSHPRYGLNDRERTSRSRSGAGRDDSQLRGRAAIPPSSALFAGDESATPSLSGVSAQLAKSGRSGKARGYSPASFRQFGEARGETPSRPSFPVPSAAQSRSRERGQSPKRKISKPSRSITHAIEEDISMIMRKRAVNGYCLSKVCLVLD